MPTVSQDKDASLYYWLDFSAVVGDQTIDSVSIDPGGTLGDLTITSMGVNTTQLTDAAGNTYAIGKVLGIIISGGSLRSRYEAVNRLTLNSGESDDRTLTVEIVDK